jgi:hypothetical protein
VSEYESTPYDGHHTQGDSESSWRTNAAERFVGYGNWAGPGNRMDHEEPGYIADQRQRDPNYDPYLDPHFLNNPRYQAIDGMDAAAQRHDHGYHKHLGADAGMADMFTWDGLNATREDDRRLVADTRAEMGANGGRYSEDAQGFAKGLQGFFGARVMGQDAVDWAGNKAGEAGQGISNFVGGARNWNSVGDAARGIGQGISGAGSWLADTGREAWQGVSGAAQNIGGLGWQGALGAAGGFLNVAGAGALHAGGQLWDGARSLGSSAINGISNAAGTAGRAIANGASAVGGAVANGASAVGGMVANGARAAGSAVASGASAVGGAVASGARAVGGAVASGASAVGGAVASGARAVGGAVANGASAVAGGARRAWNWLTG